MLPQITAQAGLVRSTKDDIAVIIQPQRWGLEWINRGDLHGLSSISKALVYCGNFTIWRRVRELFWKPNVSRGKVQIGNWKTPPWIEAVLPKGCLWFQFLNECTSSCPLCGCEWCHCQPPHVALTAPNHTSCVVGTSHSAMQQHCFFYLPITVSGWHFPWGVVVCQDGVGPRVHMSSINRF